MLTHSSYYEFEENSGELNKIKLRLRYSKALGSKFTEEQDEYNYVRSINACMNIQSKPEYNDKKDKHSNFIASPDNYFKKKSPELYSYAVVKSHNNSGAYISSLNLWSKNYKLNYQISKKIYLKVQINLLAKKLKFL